MKINNKALLLLSLLSGYFFFACEEDSSTNPPDGSYIYEVPEETDDGWQTASLSSVGMNTLRLVPQNRIKELCEVHSVT
jgi:hypothetical protein